MSSPKKYVTYYLDEDMVRMVKEMAKSERRSVSNMVGEVIISHYAQYHKTDEMKINN